jgi:mannan endo-1,4-beta-mannosidase
VFVLTASAIVGAPAVRAATGFHIAGGQLVEANGTPFVMRGTNFYYSYPPWRPYIATSLADIKSLGANSVRVVLSGRKTPGGEGDVANIVGLCKANKLICVLADSDASGDRDWPLTRSADYWIGVKSALQGQENFVLVNIGNEPPPKYNDGTDWTSATTAAISKLRNAGIDNTIVVDAPFGEDQTFIMRDTAQTVFDSDPARNILFSVHMYGSFDTPDKVDAYLGSFQSQGLPLVVGELGYNGPGAVPVQALPGITALDPGNPDMDTVMAQAASRGIGYLGWAWNGNYSGPVPYLDQVVDFDVNQPTPAGQRLFFGANGIRATAVQATVFGD